MLASWLDVARFERCAVSDKTETYRASADLGGPGNGPRIELHNIDGIPYWYQESGAVVSVYGQMIPTGVMVRIPGGRVPWSDSRCTNLVVYP